MYNPSATMPDPPASMLLILIRLILLLILIIIVITALRIWYKRKRRVRDMGSLKTTDPENAAGIIFGCRGCRVVYSPAADEGHVIVFGGSGSGKTSAVLIPTLRSISSRSRSTVFVIDIAGDISQHAAAQMQNALIYAPGSPDTIPYSPFSIVDALESNDDRNEAMENMAYLLMPDIPGAAANAKFYNDEGRKILTAALIAGYHDGMEFTDVCDSIVSNSYQELFEMIDQAGCPAAIRYINGFSGGSPQTTAGCMQSAAAAITLFATNAAVKKSLRRPQYSEYSKNEYYTPAILETHNVFVIIPDDKIELYQPLMQLLVSQTMSYLGSRPITSRHTILLCLDELPSLGHLPVLDVVRKYRKRKVRLLALTQSLADLDLTYGRTERIAILENFRYTLVLGATNIETQEYFAKRAGYVKKKQITTTSRMYDRSTVSETETREPAIDPQEFARLGDHLLLLYPGGYIRLRKDYYFKQPDSSVLGWLMDRIDDLCLRGRA